MEKSYKNIHIIILINENKEKEYKEIKELKDNTEYKLLNPYNSTLLIHSVELINTKISIKYHVDSKWDNIKPSNY